MCAQAWSAGGVEATVPKHGSGLLLCAIRWMSKWKVGEMIVVWPLHEKKKTNYMYSIEVDS